MGYGQYSENTQVRHNPLANTSKPAKRQKQVFDTDELPHLWAHRTQDSARNAQGNLYFADGVIYSYGDRFPIAAHVVNKRGQAAILFTTRTYSVTTSRHTRAVRRAIPSGTVRFDVALTSSMLPLRDGALDSATIIQAYRDEIRERIGNASAARMGKKIQEHLESARRELAELLRFVEFFGLPQMSERARIESRKLPHIPATVEEAKELGKAEKQERQSSTANNMPPNTPSASNNGCSHTLITRPDGMARTKTRNPWLRNSGMPKIRDKWKHSGRDW